MKRILRGKAHQVFAILRRMAHPAPMMGEIRCGWCNAYMGAKLGISGITHGICLACIEKETAKSHLTKAQGQE